MRKSLLFFIPVAALLAGCGDDGTGPSDSEPRAIVVSPLPGLLAVGATASLTATVRDGAGRLLTDVEVEWESRDTTTVTVDGAGTATAIRMGEAWVVARAGSLADSTVVAVHHILASGEARVRVRGRDEFEVVFVTGSGLFVDFLGRDDADVFQTVFLSSSRDTALVTLHPGMIPSGVTELQDWDPAAIPEIDSGLDLAGPAVYMVLEEPNRGAIRLLASARPSRIDVWLESVPPGPGSEEGALTARVVAELRRYRVEAGPAGLAFDPLPGRDTLYADLRPAFVHWPVGNSTGAVAGGPAPGGWELRETWWNSSFREGFHVLDVEDGPPDILVVAPLASVGDVAVGAEESAEGPDRRARVSLYDWGESPYQARSTSGTFEITRFVAPSGSLYGEVEGRLRADLTGTSYGSGTGLFPLEVSLEFHSPVWPDEEQAGRSTPASMSRPPGVLGRLVPSIPAPSRWRSPGYMGSRGSTERLSIHPLPNHLPRLLLAARTTRCRAESHERSRCTCRAESFQARS